MLASGTENEVLEEFLVVVGFKNVFPAFVLVGRMLGQSRTE